MHFLDSVSAILMRASYVQAETAEAYESSRPFTSLSVPKRLVESGWEGVRLVSTWGLLPTGDGALI